MMNHRSRQYAPSATQAVFPLGGIGSGNISLGVRGNLQDWEIFNAPAKGTYLPNTFACISALPHGGERITRVLEGPIAGTHALSHGYHPHTAYGLPRFAQSSLAGTYPIAELSLSDDAMPLTVNLEAFTPFVPLNPIDSGMPAAVFNYTVINTSHTSLDITLAFSLYDATAGVHFDKYGNLSGLGGGVITYSGADLSQHTPIG
jgi:non-lysosomal glucosylceramidase